MSKGCCIIGLCGQLNGHRARTPNIAPSLASASGHIPAVVPFIVRRLRQWLKGIPRFLIRQKVFKSATDFPVRLLWGLRAGCFWSNSALFKVEARNRAKPFGRKLLILTVFIPTVYACVCNAAEVGAISAERVTLAVSWGISFGFYETRRGSTSPLGLFARCLYWAHAKAHTSCLDLYAKGEENKELKGRTFNATQEAQVRRLSHSQNHALVCARSSFLCLIVIPKTWRA